MWMYSEDKKSSEYLKGVREFMDCVIDYKKLWDDKIILCPCLKCQNLVRHKDGDQVELHLYKNGFMKFYSLWIWHGEHIENFVEAVGTSRIVLDSKACTKILWDESVENVLDESENENVEITENIGNHQCTDNDIHLDEIMSDVENDCANILEILKILFRHESNILLYPECTKFSKICAIFKLYNLKAKNG
jgi:Transposase-associated domain